MPGLDRTDFAILRALRQNARLSNKELAAAVRLSESACLARVRRLVKAGVITGFHAAIAPAAMGIGLQALVGVRLSRHAREHVARFRAHVLSLPEVIGLYHVSGATDFLIHVAVRDSDHLRDFELAAFTTRAEVQHLETALIFEYVRPH